MSGTGGARGRGGRGGRGRARPAPLPCLLLPHAAPGPSRGAPKLVILRDDEKVSNRRPRRWDPGGRCSSPRAVSHHTLSLLPAPEDGPSRSQWPRRFPCAAIPLLGCFFASRRRPLSNPLRPTPPPFPAAAPLGLATEGDGWRRSTHATSPCRAATGLRSGGRGCVEGWVGEAAPFSLPMITVLRALRMRFNARLSLHTGRPRQRLPCHASTLNEARPHQILQNPSRTPLLRPALLPASWADTRRMRKRVTRCDGSECGESCDTIDGLLGGDGRHAVNNERLGPDVGCEELLRVDAQAPYLQLPQMFPPPERLEERAVGHAATAPEVEAL